MARSANRFLRGTAMHYGRALKTDRISTLNPLRGLRSSLADGCQAVLVLGGQCDNSLPLE